MTVEERSAEIGERFARRYPGATRTLLALAAVTGAALIVWRLTEWVGSVTDLAALVLGLLGGVVVCSFWWSAAKRHYDVGRKARLLLTWSSLLGGILVFEVAFALVGDAVRVASAGCLLVMVLWMLPALALGQRLQGSDPAEAERTLERSREIFPRY